jgi:polyisoprenoid-binding protein YceI
MTLRAPFLRILLHFAGAALLWQLTTPAAQAQGRWVVDKEFSLAWWQVSPHLNHLWATTCPEEPSWRPGEGRSGGWNIDPELKTESKTGYQNVADTIHVPLYPRTKVESECTESVSGWVALPDTVRWTNIRGQVAVRLEPLVSGHDQRDAFMRRSILQTTRYRDARFTLDSVIGVTRQDDTLRGTGIGTFTLREVSQPMTAQLVAWREAGGLRVLSKLRIPAKSLVPVYGVSQFALGLGVGTKIWQDLFAGVDMILRPEGAPAGN